MVRQNLQQAGIKIEMTPTDVAGWGERLNKWDYDLAFTYVYQYGDPALGVARNYTSDNIAQGSPFNNVEGYRNAKVDELFHAGAREMDPAGRGAIYQQVQKILLDEMPVVWMHELNFPTLYRSRVNNLISSGIGLNDSWAGHGWPEAGTVRGSHAMQRTQRLVGRLIRACSPSSSSPPSTSC